MLWFNRLRLAKNSSLESIGIPPPMGTTPIPAGYVRVYHQTPLENVESIKAQGILHSHMKGIEGPKRIYVWKTPFYGSSGSHATVEISVPEEVFDPPQFLTIKDVPTENIIAIHEPWHELAKGLIENYPTLEAIKEHFGDDWKNFIASIDNHHKKAIDAYIKYRQP